jgi:capsular exopolysaccharide synthesis family protein
MVGTARKYFVYVLRRIWIAALVAVVLGAGAFLFLRSRPTTFQAEAKIFIGSALESNNPDLNSINFGIRLAPTYAELATTTEVIQATIQNLGLNVSPENLARRISTRPIVDTAIIVIRVTDTDADRAVEIVNEHARNLIERSPSALTEEEERLLEIQSQQITAIQNALLSLNEQASALLTQISDAEVAGNPREVEVLTADYNRVLDRVGEARSQLAQFSNTYSSYANRLNRLELFEAATNASESGGISPLFAGALAALAGGGLAVAGILLYLEYADDRLRTEREVAREVDMPVMGAISRSPQLSKNHAQLLSSGMLTREHIAEQYRIVQTNLLLSSENPGGGVAYVIASPGAQEGRTFTAANLAVIIAEYGLKVLLVDANLRQPALHTLFKLDNTVGLATLLAAEAGDSDRLSALLDEAVQETATPRLHVLTSGLNGSELSSRVLGFENLQHYVALIRGRDQYDVILFDTPPSLTLADSYVVARAAGASVILLVESAGTSRVDLTKIKEQFINIKTPINGVIINKI